MKKAERTEYILNEAEELARSGKHSDFMSIEFAIRNDGFVEARSILDNPSIRERLNSTCKTAQSPEEVENRILYKNWISATIPNIFETIKKQYPNASIYCSEEYFSISFGNNRIDIYKSFASKKLRGILHFIATDDQSYKMNYDISKKNFEELSEDDFLTLAQKVSSKK